MKTKHYRLIAIIGTFILWIFPFQERLEAEEGLKINNIAVCKNVVNRTPIEPAVEFGEDVAKLYCFTAVANTRAPDTITHVWIYDGEEIARFELNVGTSPNWRTWSSKTILPKWTGPWKVCVLDPSGVEIGSVDFHIGPAEIVPEEIPEPVVPEEILEPVAPEEIPEPEEKPEEEAPAPEEEAAPEDTVEQDTTPKL